jgi:DNA invertase Pin-like site-specific DNA recombinase
MVEKNAITSLSVITIDRLGRDLKDILNVITFFNEKKISIHFVTEGLHTLDNNGKENAISKMIISILGVVAEMERSQLKERQREGIEIAKLKGIYKGRITGTKEDKDRFLSKPKIKKHWNIYGKAIRPVKLQHWRV